MGLGMLGVTSCIYCLYNNISSFNNVMNRKNIIFLDNNVCSFLAFIFYTLW